MTIEGLLFVIIQLMLLLNWPVAFILIRAASRKPRIRALTVMAVATTLIATGLSVYVWAVINSAMGYIVSKEAAVLLFRLVLIGLAAFPIWFLWLYVTGRFRDGSPADLYPHYSAAERDKSTERLRVEVDNAAMAARAPVDEPDPDAT